jgi:hypothetical protein
MENEKDKWITEIMDAAAEVHLQHKAPQRVYNRISISIDQPSAKDNTVSFRQFRLISAAAVIILAMNIGIVGFNLLKPDNKDAGNSYGIESFNLNIY